MCAVQGRFRFHGKRAGNILSAEYDAAAKMLKMPLEKSGGGKRTEAIRDGLRQLRQTRPRSIPAESRTLGVVQRLSSGEQIACPLRLNNGEW